MPYTELPPPRAPLTLRDDAQALACLRERVPDGLAAPAMCVGYDEAIAAVVREMASVAADQSMAARPLQMRLLSLLRQQYEQVALPVPGLDGELGSDQLMCVEGDWIVYRALLLISRLAPGALRPKQVHIHRRICRHIRSLSY